MHSSCCARRFLTFSLPLCLCHPSHLQLVDFRSSEEHKEDTAWSLMLSNGVIKTYDAYGAVVEVRSGWAWECS